MTTLQGLKPRSKRTGYPAGMNERILPMLDNNDLSAVKKIIEDALRQHLVTCPLGEGLTKDELRSHGLSHRNINEFITTIGKTKKIWLYFFGLLVTIYIPLLVKFLWP